MYSWQKQGGGHNRDACLLQKPWIDDDFAAFWNNIQLSKRKHDPEYVWSEFMTLLDFMIDRAAAAMLEKHGKVMQIFDE